MRLPGKRWEGERYKYCVEAWDGRRTLKADPFAAMVQTQGETASIVWCREDYEWGDQDFLDLRAASSFMTSPMTI